MGLGEDIALWLMMCGNTIKSHLTLFFRHSHMICYPFSLLYTEKSMRQYVYEL